MGASNTSVPGPCAVPTTVMIVGAGPVGLLLANLLQKWGVSFRLIDKNAGPSTATTSRVVHSRTLEMLRHLGVAEQAVSNGFTLKQFSLQANSKRVPNDNFSYLDACYPFLLSLPASTLEQILLERLDASGLGVEWNTELVELQNQPQSVQMLLHHADGRDERLSARWMVACDGAHRRIATSQPRRVQALQHDAVFLAGDSAPIGHPLADQAINLGMGEAYNLAWKIAYVDQGLAAPALLQSYNEECFPTTLRAESMVHRVLVWLRDNILPLLGDWRPLQRTLASMICAHHYRYGKSTGIQESLTNKQRAHWNKKGRKSRFPTAAPRAGQLAPDIELWQPPGTPPRRLMDLFQGTFTLLVFSAADQFSSLLPGYYVLADAVQTDYPGIKAYCVIDALGSAGAPFQHSTLLDPDWRLHKRYHARAGTLMLIRPDGYIAFQGLDITTLMTYLHVRSGLIKVNKKATSSENDLTALPI